MVYEEYVRQVRDFSDFLKRTKEEFFKNKVLECSGDRGALYRLVDVLIGKSHTPILPKRSSELDVATNLATIFQRKFRRFVCLLMKLPKNVVYQASMRHLTVFTGSAVASIASPQWPEK